MTKTTPILKTCPKCGEHKLLSEYQRSGRNGVQSRCRECRNAVYYKRKTQQSVFNDLLAAGKIRCTKCGEVKGVDSFHRKNNKVGRRTICKQCRARTPLQIIKQREESSSLLLNELRRCSGCGEVKPLSDFFVDRRRKDGYMRKCKSCIRAVSEPRRKEMIKSEAYIQKMRTPAAIAKRKAYYASKGLDFYREQRKRRRPKLREWERKKTQSDLNYRVARVLRNRLRMSLKGERKSLKTIELLGCDIEFLKGWLSSQFKEGMTWDHYGHKGWHIDHIRPCASFDFSKEEDQRQCFHYTNLQPLWWWENLRKWKKEDSEWVR